jgi:hypothetical protein
MGGRERGKGGKWGESRGKGGETIGKDNGQGAMGGGTRGRVKTE